MKKSGLKQIIKEVVKEIAAVKPDYGTQLNMAMRKARKDGNVEAIAYYEWIMSRPTSASASFEQFKNSWAYTQWIKSPKIQQRIKDVEAEQKRFSYLREVDLVPDRFKNTLVDPEEEKEEARLLSSIWNATTKIKVQDKESKGLVNQIRLHCSMLLKMHNVKPNPFYKE